MARRRKTSPAEGLMEAISLLPWWAGIGLAVLSYVVLHHFATQAVPMTADAQQIGDTVSKTLIVTFAGIGQYVVPVLCFVGAGVSALRHRERQVLFDNTTQNHAAGALDGMSWQQFEQLVGEAFRSQGYQVQETGGGGADGGVDLVIVRNGERFLVQCKQWRAFKVGVDVVRELYGVMAAKGAAGGFVVTSGRYTDEAFRFAAGRNVTLMDGAELHRLIQGVKNDKGVKRSGALIAVDMPTSGVRDTEAACPLCAKPMVKRVAKRGGNAGAQFLGCSAYPACKGTRALP